VAEVKVLGRPDDVMRVRTPPRPQPLDPAALVLAVVGTAVLLATAQPTWTSVLVLAAAATALTAPGRVGLVWAWVGLAAAAVGWLAAATFASFGGGTATISELLAWAPHAVPLVLTGAMSLEIRRRTLRTAERARHAQAHAEAAAVQDQLTGLANRKGLAMLAEPILEAARRRGDAVYCVFVDVDGLSQVNADRGRSAGDDVLLAVADALGRSTRGTDAVARWGDDEFVVVGPGTGLPPLEIERRVRARLREAPSVDRSAWQPRISAGGAVLEPWDDGDVEGLLRQAGREMHVRRALRREAAAPTYQPRARDLRSRPPEPRPGAGS
jgi:diguanylate cyclase (GGDEF)-like protein